MIKRRNLETLYETTISTNKIFWVPLARFVNVDLHANAVNGGFTTLGRISDVAMDSTVAC